MKAKAKAVAGPQREIPEDEIRDYAYHLYQQSGCVPGHDVENWLEAKACLEANIPREHSRVRLHRHRHPKAAKPVQVIELAGRDGERPVPAVDDAVVLRQKGIVLPAGGERLRR